MKHFTSEEGIDFVNKVMPATKHAEMQQHLNSGCKQCAKVVTTWQEIRQAAAREKDYQPSAGLLQIAKAAFAAAGMESEMGGLKTIFDSFLQPAAAGVRSIAPDAGTRQVLYGVGPYLLDIYISPRSHGKLIGVTGQLMNFKNPDLILSSVPVIVSNRDGHATVALTNQFGEFQGEVENRGDLELRLPTPQGKDIVVPLGCLVTGLEGSALETLEKGKNDPDS
jgi:hypothetical protein